MRRGLFIFGAVIVAAAVALLVLPKQPAPAETLLAVEAALARGDSAGARAAIDRANLDAPTRAYAEGIVKLSQGDDAGAAPLLEVAHAAQPDAWRFAGALAAAARNHGDFRRAREVVEGYLVRHPSDERALLLSAQLWLDARDRVGRNPRLGLEALDRIAGLSQRIATPDDPTAIRDEQVTKLRAQAEAELGKSQDSLADARALVHDRPRDAKAWYLLGDVARRAMRTDESLDAYRKAVDLEPGNRQYAEQLVFALLQFQAPAPELLQRTEKLLASAPQDPALLVLRARALVRDDETPGQVDAADGIYRELEKRTDLPREILLQVLRNHALLLYDWKQAGREGAYLDESWALLRKYRELGGEIDDRLRPTWDELEQRVGRKK